MNDTSLNLPWVDFILCMWLKDELAEKNIDVRARAKDLDVIKADGVFWHVDKDWFHDKLASDKEILNVTSPEYFGLLVLGISELMARTTQYMTRDIVNYITKAPAYDKIQECLLCIDNNVKTHFPPHLDLSIETQGELQLVNSVKITPKNFKSVDRLLRDGPRPIIRSDSYGLSGALTLLLNLDASAVGAWLQGQEHPLILDAALYALKHTYMMTLSTGHEQEVCQLARSAHPLISLTGLVIAQTVHLKEWYPIWSIPLGGTFKLLENADVPIEVSVWASLFRLDEISKIYEREKQRHQESKKYYAYSSEDANYLYGKEEYHYKNMERQVRQKEFLANLATEIIQEIISHWPPKGLPQEALMHCAEIISSSELWLEFLEKIPVVSDRELLIKHVLRSFISASDLFKHGERGHCYATEQMLLDADFTAKSFLLLKPENLGKAFGKLFFSDKKESLNFDDKILSEPYAHRKRFEGYNHALNALGVAHYIALQIGNEGLAQKRDGAEFLLKKGSLGLLKVITAAQGDWDIAEEALQRLSFALLESLTVHTDSILDEEIEPFLQLPHLQSSFKAMLGFSRPGILKRQSNHIFSLLAQSFLPSPLWHEHFKRVASSFLAYDFALMRLAQDGDSATAHNVTELWQVGLLRHIDSIPSAFVGAIEKIEKALFGDKQCFEWLVNNPNLSNTWSANYLREKHAKAVD